MSEEQQETAERNEATAPSDIQKPRRKRPAPAPESGLMDVQGAAAYLGVPTSTVYKLTHLQQIPVIRLSKGCLRFAKVDLDAWILSKRSIPPSGRRRAPRGGAR